MKLFVFTLLLSLLLSGIGVDAEASISGVDDEHKSDGPDSTSVLEQLESKIRALEYHIEEKTREINDKDVVIAAKEDLIKRKADSILSLESEIASLQEKEKSNAEKEVGKAQARSSELENHVEKLKKDLEVKIKEKEQLEARILETEKKASELITKVNSLQKVIDDQQTKLRKTERALQMAEEEMMKAKYEVASKTKELMEVHGAWFPPWLAAHLIRCQSHLDTKWNVHGKPVLDQLTQKAIEKKAQAGEWAAPHVETMKNKWAPAIKEQWIVVDRNVRPHVQTIYTKTIDTYEATKGAISPHIIKVLEFVDPHYQKMRKISNPYIDQVATVARPHVDTLRVALKPYTEKAAVGYGKFIESAKTCHLQISAYIIFFLVKVQDKVQETLKSHELTEPLATKELVWFTASALLALPIIFVMKICSAVCCKKVQTPARATNRRRVKPGSQD